MGFKVEVWSDYALFTRPEMKTERCSYDVMTASAARGLLESIYWHPGMRWVVDCLYVMNPIKFDSVRRNEVSKKFLASQALSKAKNPKEPVYLVTAQEIQQRASLLLKDVRYVIEAHFEMTEKKRAEDNPGKFSAIIKRRLERGQCYSQPYMGCREFAANFRLWDEVEVPTIDQTKDLGYMLLDMDFRDPENIRPIFYRVKMKNGVVRYPDPVVWLQGGGGEVIHGSIG